MDFEIQPFVGAGPIQFGMTQQQVRGLLGGQVESFMRTPASAYPCDHYERLGVFVYYKDPGIVQAMEFHEPANPTLSGVSLLTESATKVKSLLFNSDPATQGDSVGFTANAVGVGAYAPEADDDPSAPVESVIVFERGYYT